MLARGGLLFGVGGVGCWEKKKMSYIQCQKCGFYFGVVGTCVFTCLCPENKIAASALQYKIEMLMPNEVAIVTVYVDNIIKARPTPREIVDPNEEGI